MIFDKINIASIIEGHFNTLVDEKTKKLDFFDVLIFIMLPFGFSLFLTFFFTEIEPLQNILITSLTIFTGLLFNLLVLMYDIIKRRDDKYRVLLDESEQNETFNKKNELIELKISGRFLEQLFNNISYSVLISIFAIASLVLSYLTSNLIADTILRFLIFFFSINFFLTLLMVLKRTHKLILFKNS